MSEELRCTCHKAVKPEGHGFTVDLNIRVGRSTSCPEHGQLVVVYDEDGYSFETPPGPIPLPA